MFRDSSDRQFGGGAFGDHHVPVPICRVFYYNTRIHPAGHCVVRIDRLIGADSDDRARRNRAPVHLRNSRNHKSK
jgi:hypothetical protein